MILARRHREPSETLLARQRVLPDARLPQALGLAVLRIEETREEEAVDSAERRLLGGGGVLHDVGKRDGAVATSDQIGAERDVFAAPPLVVTRRNGDGPEVGRPDADAKRVDRCRVTLGVRDHEGLRGQPHRDLVVQPRKPVFEADPDFRPLEGGGEQLANEPLHPAAELPGGGLAQLDEVGDQLDTRARGLFHGLDARAGAHHVAPNEVLDELLFEEVRGRKDDVALLEAEDPAELPARRRQDPGSSLPGTIAQGARELTVPLGRRRGRHRSLPAVRDSAQAAASSP